MADKRGGTSTSTVLREHTHLTADRVKPKDTKWVWWPRVPGGNITILAAKDGTGKGVMCSDLVASVTLEATWPLSDEYAPDGAVLWCEAEDSFDYAVVPRLTAAQADLSRVILKRPREFFDLDLGKFIRDEGVKLIVLSPLNSFLSDLNDANHGLNVRRALEQLQEGIENTNCAVVAICHLNKKVDLDAVERILGSVEYANFVRSVVLLRKDTEEDAVRMVHVKSNLGPMAPDLLFTIRNTKPKTHPRGQYIGVDWRKPENNVDPDHFLDRKPEGTKDSKVAADWLFSYLDDGTWKDTTEVFNAGEKHSYTKASLKKARQRSAGKIEYKRKCEGGKVRDYWRLTPD